MSLLVQVAVIVACARLFARAARALGQPEVIGEIAAGLLLGPSFLGWLWPEAQARLFAPDALGGLQRLSHAGLVLFMFAVGLDVNPGLLKGRARAAVLISHSGILLPLLSGAALAVAIRSEHAPAGVPLLPFALFLGTAMSVTAFPVLARIIRERGLSRSPLGTMALTCAAVDDATAWCLLAAVAGLARGGAAFGALGVLAACAAFALAMVFAVRPALARLLAGRSGGLWAVAAVAAAFVSAWATEAIGVHALFGAFLAGAIMPREPALLKPLEGPLARALALLLLPIFFALTGLRTEVGLLRGAAAWGLCAAVILVAVAGKFCGGALAARWAGMTWRDSLAIGTLMNARGLVELVVLSVGYDLGIIGPALFTMMVLMALVTTAMTGPLLGLLLPRGGGAA